MFFRLPVIVLGSSLGFRYQMDPAELKTLLEEDAKHVSPAGMKFLYGTAGFRSK